MPVATITVNGVTIKLEGSKAELAQLTSLLVDKEAPAKAKVQPKAAPKPVIERKTDGIGEGKALTKDSRAAFAKAFVKAFGEADVALAKEVGAKGTMLHWSTKQLATYAIATNQTPKGYRVGGGYYQLLGAEAERVIAEAKKHLPEAPKGRVRNAKGQFVKS